MHAGFKTHSIEHWHQFIKCDFKEKKRNNSQEDNKHFANVATSIGSVSHHAACGPLTQGAIGICVLLHTMGGAGWMSLGSLLLPSKVTLVTSWSLLSEPCMSPGHGAMKLPYLFLSWISLWSPNHLHILDQGSLGNLCILVKNGFHCTLRVSSS